MDARSLTERFSAQPGTVHLVGAGPGDPGLLTLRAAALLASADLVLHDQLVTTDVLALAGLQAELVPVGRRCGTVVVRHEEVIGRMIDAARAGARVVRLKGGDPMVFGRGGEEAQDLIAAGVPVEVVPGVTAAIAGPASAGIPVTHRGVATGVAFVTGHEDPAKGAAEVDWEALARSGGTLVILMGAGRVHEITAKLVADLLTAAGVDRVLALDLHAGQIQGFFNIPVDHLFAGPPVIVEYLSKKDLRDPVVVAPDAGGVERARAIAKRLKAGLAIIDKRRDRPNVAVMMHLIGDVKDKDAIVIDDMIDTAGTLTQAAEALAREGARRSLACGVHPVLSGPAIARIQAAPLEEVIVTNSIPLTPDKHLAKLTVLSVGPLLAEAIRRIHDEESVSTLFV